MRIVSIWLPHWPIERLRRHIPGAVPDDVPLALVQSGAHGLIISAVNARAAREGVSLGASLADARAALPALLSRTAEPRADLIALLKLTRWLGRYGPNRHRDGLDGAWIDITGVAHLFGGEDALMKDLVGRLRTFGVSARVGLADTFGAAHALARFATTRRASAIAPAERSNDAIASLPVEALRLAPDAVLLLKRLGLRRIGQLTDLPRAALEQRFRSEVSAKSRAREMADLSGAVILRLDQALGRAAEPLRALAERPVLSVRRTWSEPLISSDALGNEVAALTGELSTALKRAHLGARRVGLTLYRADGTTAHFAAGFSAATQDSGHIELLLSEKMQAIDAGFGIDVAQLDARQTERSGAEQSALGRGFAADHTRAEAALIDRLSNRLGAHRITRIALRASHIPERASVHVPAQAPRAPNPDPHIAKARPILLLSPPEPIEVMAEVPEGPPKRFVWRRTACRIVKAEGPERIAPEWWRDIGKATPDAPGAGNSDLGLGEIVPRITHARPRDYYIVETSGGARFWVYRDGLYQNAAEDGAPRWLMHGLFG